MIRYLAALAVLVVGLAACGGSTDEGWTEAQHDAYVLEQYKGGDTLAQAECLADFYEQKFPDYDKLLSGFEDMTFDEMFADETMAEYMAVGMMGDAKCGTE